jgi:hypothetical protein
MPCMPEIASKGTILKKLDALLSDHYKRVAMYPDLMSGYYPAASAAPGAAIMPLTTIANNHGAGLTQAEMDHINGDWFGLIPTRPAWWKCAVETHSPGTLSGVEEVVREGMIQAILKAEELQVPVSCDWFCHRQHFHYEAHSGSEGGRAPEGTSPVESEELKKALVEAIEDAATKLGLTVADALAGACLSLDDYPHVEVTVCWSLDQVSLNLHTPGPPYWLPLMNPALMTIDDPIKVIRHDNPNGGAPVVVVQVKHMHTMP